jgi:alginate O-acetyltransferase complex protein AlgI
MLFNSFEYLLFFIIVLGAGWLLVGFPRLRIWLLLLASYHFYISNNRWMVILILVSTQVDYLAGVWIENSKSPVKRRGLLACSLATNLCVLGVFKYLNFFADSFSHIVGAFGWHLSWVDVRIALPVGISFYTFQSMSYTIDVYRGSIRAERNWYRFAFYIAYFPQLIAGPIVRARDFLPQVPQRPRLSRPELEWALQRVMQGLFKKIVVADFLASYADQAFKAPASIDFVGAWIGLYAFTFQIYYDFAGYSDIAVGCSRLMGYRIPENFARPYVASSISDFWHRWHISLSTWLRDYLYIPLGGNRVQAKWNALHFLVPMLAAAGFLSGYAWSGIVCCISYLVFLVAHRGVTNNLMLTMLLAGLWHGAAWHFVLWGFLHGIGLVTERTLGVQRKDPAAGDRSQVALTFRRLTIFNGIVFTWLVFRCSDMRNLGDYLMALVDLERGGTLSTGSIVAVLLIAAGLLAQYLHEHWDLNSGYLAMPIYAKSGLYAAVAVAVLVMNSRGAQTFIYFRF